MFRSKTKIVRKGVIRSPFIYLDRIDQRNPADVIMSILATVTIV